MLLLTFTADLKPFAVAVSRIVEVLPKIELRPIPHAPEFLAGLLNYRGRVVPVIDLGLLLGSTPCRSLLSSRMIVVNDIRDNLNPEGPISAQPGDRAQPTRDQAPVLLGLLAENVNELIYVQPAQISPVPVQVPNAPYVDAVVHTDRQIVPLIAVQKVRSYVLRGAFFDQSAILNPPSLESDSIDSRRKDRAHEF
jgi:chemotaxis-related protein WspB